MSSVVAGSVWRLSFHAGRSNRDRTFDTAEEKEEMEVNSKRSIRLLTKLLPPLAVQRLDGAAEVVNVQERQDIALLINDGQRPRGFKQVMARSGAHRAD
jgi:hypothetical protein